MNEEKKIGVKKEGKVEEGRNEKKERRKEREEELEGKKEKKIGRWTTAKGNGNRRNVSTNNNTHTWTQTPKVCIR